MLFGLLLSEEQGFRPGIAFSTIGLCDSATTPLWFTVKQGGCITFRGLNIMMECCLQENTGSYVESVTTGQEMTRVSQK